MNRLKPVVPFFLASGLFITAFITYLFTLSPSNYFGDSGELISMISTLGVPHPTGFPLYILAGKVFSFLPLASPAFRINLMSAFFGSLVPVLIFFAARMYAKKDSDNFTSLYLPFAAAALFIFSYTLWSQSVVARIYSFNALFCAAALALFLYYSEVSRSQKTLYLLAFITGLGAGLHLSFITFTGILWIYLVIKNPGEIKKIILPITAFFITGLSIYFYITIRGASGAELKWAELNGLDDLRKYFSQAQYKAKMFSRDAQGYAYFFGFIKSAVTSELSGLGLFLFLAGAAWSVQKRFKYFWPFLLIFVSNILTLAVYGNYTDMPLSFRYLIPSYIISVFFIYLFCSYLYGMITDKRAAAASSLACLVFILLACYPVNRYENDRSNNFTAYFYPMDLLSPMPEKSYFFTSGDNQIYTMAHAKFMQNKFPGVVVFDMIDSIFKDIRNLWSQSKSQSMPSNIITAFSKNYSPLYTTTLPGNPAIGNSSAGLVYRLYDGPSGPDDFLPWKLYSLKGILHDTRIFHAYEEREVAASYYFRMAAYYKKAGRDRIYAWLLDKAAETGYDSASSLGNIAIIWSNDYQTEGAARKADELFNRALMVSPTNADLYFNAGSFYARVEAWDKAAEMFAKASELNPGNIMARVYLGRVQQEIEKNRELENKLQEQAIRYEKAREYFTEKNYDMAIDEFNKDIELNPSLDRSYFHLGLIHSIRGEIEKAVPFYEKAVQNNGKNISALNNLGLCYLKLNKKSMAKKMFDLSISINPDQERVKKILETLK